MNKEVNLTKRVNTPRGLRFCPVVISANGRVKPDYVLIGGKEQRRTVVQALTRVVSATTGT